MLFYGGMYTDVIKVSPEVMAELRRLKELYQLQSHNKVLKRLLGITKDGVRDAT